MKLVLDEEEIWIIECIKEAHIDCGFHIRDVIKKQKQSMDSPDQQYMKS